MMRTLEIPKERWSDFLELLEKRLADRPVRVEVLGENLGDQELSELNPFRGLEYEIKGSEAGALTLTIGSDGEESVHRMRSPSRLYLGLNEDGESEWLAIESEGGARTLIHFEKLPELQIHY